MKAKVLILVEGITEETFVRDVLSPHFMTNGIFITAKLVTTKRVKDGPDFKGGIRTYGKVKNDILRLLTDTSATAITTFIDYYGLPTDFPGYSQCPGITQCFDRINFLEEAFLKDIDNRKFIPYIQLHEYEALLFSSPKEIAKAFPASNKEKELQDIIAKFNTPEEINNSTVTAPSKRLLRLYSDYSKTVHGPLVASRIGLDNIRKKCKHFNSWIDTLENLGTVS